MTDKKKHNGKIPASLILGCVILFVLILIIGIAVMLGTEAEIPTVAPSAGTVESTDADASSGSEALSAATVTQAQTGTSTQQETSSGGEDDPAPETKPVQTTEPVIQAPATMPQMKEASYEQWLSAGMVVGLSMSYPDFELQGIYVTGETALEDRMSSDGACVLFTSGGKALALHSTPLEEERKIPGTTDLSSQTIGFATFDAVDAASVDTSAMTAVDLEDLEDLIAQSMLVSLYWN